MIKLVVLLDNSIKGVLVMRAKGTAPFTSPDA
jgi:hypothetical protein